MAKKKSKKRSQRPHQSQTSRTGTDIKELNKALESSSPSIPSEQNQPRVEWIAPPPQFDYSSLNKLKAVEWIGLVGLFVSLAAGFVLGALASAGIIDLGLANALLLAAVLVLVIGAVLVEAMSRRSLKRIVVS